MIDWMLYAALVAVLIAGGALALERLVASTGRPRRFLWLAALGLAVAVPLAGRTPEPAAPAVQEAISAVTSLANGEPVEGPRNEIRTLPVPGRMQSDRVAALAWGAASLTVLAILGIVLVAVARRRRSWERRRVAGPLVYVSRGFGPALVGVLTPRVVVPSWVLRLEPAARDAIVRHEEEHARARDHLTLLCGGLVTALFPWSPAIWWMCRRLRSAVELDCDERVLASGVAVADYGNVLLEAGTRSRRWWGFAPAMGHPESLLERRLKTMSEKHAKPGWARALVLAGVAGGAVVAACDLPVPTELGDAIEEVIPVHAQERQGGAPPEGTGGSSLARWFASDPPPLVFVDGVRVERYEDLPEPVRRWSDSGLREEGLVESVEVMKGEVAEARYGEEGAAGAIRIFTKEPPPGTAIVEPSANDLARPNQGNLWGDKFSRMAGLQPMPLFIVDGQRMPPGQSFFQDLAKLDIESFDIVKGAAATMLYGEEAAGGAIQIFTKNPGSRPVAPRI
ncbi:MAG: TonB-dependent receptor plug domain-containing protein [Gemmatimonadota bacterium]|nr:TonB-dependent receptor plug domain-containing protein [Gemmatimonadota bacterium]MDE2679015.1 TonB-dependent receptor plug domain-containing protein [Gemmatimonadota bacterium]